MAVQQYKGQLSDFQQFIMSDQLEVKYPSLYKVFNRYGYLLDWCQLLELAKEYVVQDESGVMSTTVYFSPFPTVKKSPISAFNLVLVERQPVVFLLTYMIVL